MTIYHTPLGDLALVSEPNSGAVFLHGWHQDMPLTIEVSMPVDLRRIDFDFIWDKLRHFPDLKAKAEKFVRELLRNTPQSLGCKADEPMDEPLLDFAEFAFDESDRWAIVFRESSLPIAQPYGILIEFQNHKVSGFEDLSDAQEL